MIKADSANTLQCGCEIVKDAEELGIVFCQIHDAADRMRDALIKVVARWERGDLAEAVRNAASVLETTMEDDGERFPCDGCGESFNVNESKCEDHCLKCCECANPRIARVW